MAEMSTDGQLQDRRNRRPVVNGWVRRGRDAVIANCRASPTVGGQNMTSSRHCDPGTRLVPEPRLKPRHRPEAFQPIERRALTVIEIDADGGSHDTREFDPDDIDAAFAELDARYLAGEAAAHAQTWSVIAAGLRRTQPARTPRDDLGLGQHRPPTNRKSRAWDRRPARILRATWDLTPELSVDIEAVHRLDRPGRGRHPRGTRDLDRGLRRRVATDRASDGRRRPDQPLRDIRRGRPRRRACPVRRTQPGLTKSSIPGNRLWERRNLRPCLLHNVAAGPTQVNKRKGIVMGYARHIGRVGALAVTLGVGAAIASTPGIAYAGPSNPSAAGESPSTAADQSTKKSPSTTTKRSDKGAARLMAMTDSSPSGRKSLRSVLRSAAESIRDRGAGNTPASSDDDTPRYSVPPAQERRRNEGFGERQFGRLGRHRTRSTSKRAHTRSFADTSATWTRRSLRPPNVMRRHPKNSTHPGRTETPTTYSFAPAPIDTVKTAATTFSAASAPAQHWQSQSHGPASSPSSRTYSVQCCTHSCTRVRGRRRSRRRR